MDSLNIERRSLLLELIRDIIQNNIPGYNDKAIQSRIKKYLALYKEFQEKPQDFDLDKQLKLNKLHKYFYGTNFNFEDPDENDMTISTNIYEEFKRVFKKIADLAESPDKLYEELMKSLNSILITIDTISDEKQINDYLNLVNSTIQRHQNSFVSSDEKIKMSVGPATITEKPSELTTNGTEEREREKIRKGTREFEELEGVEGPTKPKEPEEPKKRKDDEEAEKLKELEKQKRILKAQQEIEEIKAKKKEEEQQKKDAEKAKYELETEETKLKLEEIKQLKQEQLDKNKIEDEERRRLKRLLEQNKEDYFQEIGDIAPEKLEEILQNLTMEKLEEKNIKNKYLIIDKIKQLIIYYYYLVKFYNTTHNYELNIILTLIKNNLGIQQINYIDMTETETPKIKELVEKNKEIINKYLRDFIKEYIEILFKQTKISNQEIINKIKKKLSENEEQQQQKGGNDGDVEDENEDEVENKDEDKNKDESLTLETHKEYLVNLLELLFKTKVEKHHSIYLYEKKEKWYDIIEKLTQELFSEEYKKKILAYFEYKIKEDLNDTSQKINLGGIQKGGGGLESDIKEYKEALHQVVLYNYRDLEISKIEEKLEKIKELQNLKEKKDYLNFDTILSKFTDENSKDFKEKENLITFTSENFPSISKINAKRIKFVGKLKEEEKDKEKIDLLENEDYLFFMELKDNKKNNFDDLIKELNESYNQKGYFSKFKSSLKNITKFNFKDKTIFIDLIINKLKKLLETNKNDLANILYDILEKIKNLDITSLDKVIIGILEEIIDEDEIINGRILLAICNIKYFKEKIEYDDQEKQLYYNFLLKYIKYKKDFLDLLTKIEIKYQNKIDDAEIPSFFKQKEELYNIYKEFIEDEAKVNRFNEEVSKVKPKTLFNRIKLEKLSFDIYLENEKDKEAVKKLLNIDISKADYELTEKLKKMIKQENILGLNLEDFKTINKLIDNYEKQEENKQNLEKIKEDYGYKYELEQLFIKDLYGSDNYLDIIKKTVTSFISKFKIEDKEKLLNLLYHIYKFHNNDKDFVLNDTFNSNFKDKKNEKQFLLMSLLISFLKYNTDDIPKEITIENIEEILNLFIEDEIKYDEIFKKLDIKDFLKDDLQEELKKEIVINYLLLLCKINKLTNSQKTKILDKIAKLKHKTTEELKKEYDIKLEENIDINEILFDDKFIKENNKLISVKEKTIKDFLNNIDNYDANIKPKLAVYLFKLINKKNEIIPEIIEILVEIYNLERNIKLTLNKDYFINKKDELEYKFIVLYTLLYKKYEKELKKLFNTLKINKEIKIPTSDNDNLINNIDDFFEKADKNSQEYKDFEKEFIGIYYFGLPKHSESISYSYNDQLLKFLEKIEQELYNNENKKQLSEKITETTDKIKYYLGIFKFKLDLINEEKVADVIQIFKIIYSLKQTLLEVKANKDKDKINKYRDTINSFFEKHIEKKGIIISFLKKDKFKITTDNILEEIQKIIKDLLYEYIKEYYNKNILCIQNSLYIVELIIILYKDLYNDNKNTLIDIIYDKTDKTKIKFIIEYLFNNYKNSKENSSIEIKLNGIILNENTNIEELLLSYFQNKLFNETIFEIKDVCKYILYILQNKINKFIKFDDNIFKQYIKHIHQNGLLIFLNIECVLNQKKTKINCDVIKKICNKIYLNYNNQNKNFDDNLNNFEEILNNNFELTHYIFLYYIENYFNNLGHKPHIMQILNELNLISKTHMHLDIKFLLCYVNIEDYKDIYDNKFFDLRYNTFERLEEKLLNFYDYNTNKDIIELFNGKSYDITIRNITNILYYKIGKFNCINLYYEEFLIDNIYKYFENFIILSKQNNYDYNYNIILQLINNIRENFGKSDITNLPDENTLLHIPDSVKEDVEHKKKVLENSVEHIGNYDKMLSVEGHLDNIENIYDIINKYNENNIKHTELLKLLLDLDDLNKDYPNISIKYLIALFNKYIKEDDFELTNIFENTDLSSYPIENYLNIFFDDDNNYDKFFESDYNNLLKFILFILSLRCKDKLVNYSYRNENDPNVLIKIILIFIYLHNFILKDKNIKYDNFINIAIKYFIPDIDQSYKDLLSNYSNIYYYNQTYYLIIIRSIYDYSLYYLNNNLNQLITYLNNINKIYILMYLVYLYLNYINETIIEKDIDKYTNRNNLDYNIEDVIYTIINDYNYVNYIKFLFKNEQEIINFMVFIYTVLYKDIYENTIEYNIELNYTIDDLKNIIINTRDNKDKTITTINLIIQKINIIFNSNLEEINYIEEEQPPPPPPRRGGNKGNAISIINVFKLYYNFERNNNDTNSVYKLYFLLNLFGYYSNDQKLLLDLIQIIELNNYTEEVYEQIKDIINKIYEITKDYFNDYIRTFNEFDSIIKNYYLDYSKLSKYLYINFIYDIYKNMEETDINFTININNIQLTIKKTNQEIKTEILKLINENDFIFIKQPINITNQFPNFDVNNFISIIYDFTSKSNTTIDNMNELNAFIVIKLLSSNDDIILPLNNNNYKIKNFKTSPYKINIPNIQFFLNKNQMELYDYLLKPENYNKLMKFLKKDYYYISFDISQDYKYKFNINSEIMNLIDEGMNIPQKSLISYPKKPISIDIRMLETLEVKDNKLLSLVYYGIYLTAGIFMKASMFNFISLIYVYSILKHSSFEFKGDYKNLLEFFEKILKLSLMKQLIIKKDINNFIKIIINFKGTNNYINKFDSQINLDTNFLNSLYNFNDEIKIEDLIEDYSRTFQILFVYLIENANIYNELEQLIHYYFITVLWGFKETGKIMEDLEKMVIDLNGKLIKMIIIPKKINGGGDNSESQIINKQPVEQAKPSNVINEEQKEELLSKLTFINNFIKEFKDFKNKYNIDDSDKNITKTYNKIINDLTTYEGDLITKINYPDVSDENFSKKLASIKSEIKEKLNNVVDLLKKYGADSHQSEPKKEELIILKKLNEDYDKIITKYIPYFDKYKDSNDILIKNIIAILKKKNEDDTEYLFDIIKKYLKIYTSIIREFIDQLNKSKKSIETTLETIKELEYKYNNYLARGQRRDNRGDSRENIGIMSGGAMDYIEQSGTNKPTDNKFEDFTDLIAKLKEKNVDEKINKLEIGIKKIKSSSSIKDTNNKSEISKEGLDITKANLFERLLYQYEDDSKITIPEIAKAKLYDKVVDNNLDPEIELEITFYDKLIFIFLIIIIRIIAVYITYYFIDNNNITTIQKGIQYYTIIYILIFFVIFMIINIDVFRLRLIFNFMNMHINSSGILIQILLKIIISYIVYLLIINIDDNTKPTKLSKHQKIKLKFKLDILTISILIFLSIFVLVI